MYMHWVKKYVLDLGGAIYYTDTDSLVTDIELPSSFISPSKLGLFKLEHKISKGYFISGKTYGILLYDKDSNGNPIFIPRAKGSSKPLTLKDF